MKKIRFSKKGMGDTLFRLSVVIFANIVLAISTMWFIEPAHLYAGGATGLSQLLQRLIIKMGGSINLGLMILLVNIPLAVLGFKYVSKKFAIYSCVAILIQSLISWLLPESSSPFKEADPLALALMGGVLSGFAAGLALKFGTSTGGIDIIAQALALHKGISIGTFTLLFNVIIAIVGGGAIQGDWTITLYTCIRMILNSLVTDKVHTAYTYSGISIFTQAGDEISSTIMKELNRGCTMFNVVGAYTHETHEELYCVVSSYEVDKVLSIIKEHDSKAFVTISPIKRIVGNFVKKTII